MSVNREFRPQIVQVLCSLALSDHLGDVRDAEEGLWKLLDAPELPYDHPAWNHDSAWRVTEARLKAAGYELPAYFGDGDLDD